MNERVFNFLSVVITAVTISCGGIVWAYSTFATKESVLEIHDDIREIRTDVKNVLDKVYELNGEKAPSKK